ncbi:MAG: helical backbone metal receptor [Bacteroidia bacterium]
MDLGKVFTDQLGRTVSLPESPKRIISLVPSQTELLADLGLNNEVVGITKFCIHPDDWFRSKTRVGGTKKVNFSVIHDLNPDLIIANKEENTKEDIDELSKHYPVWISDIITLQDALDMILAIGAITERTEKAKAIATRISEGFKNFTPIHSGKTAAYLIWRDPWMAAGHNTFINHVIELCGFKNIYINESSRYPETTLKQLAELQPDIIMLSSEPYPFSDKHIEEIKSSVPQSRIILADGEMFSWYGSRLLQTPSYLMKLLNSIR